MFQPPLLILHWPKELSIASAPLPPHLPHHFSPSPRWKGSLSLTLISSDFSPLLYSISVSGIDPPLPLSVNTCSMVDISGPFDYRKYGLNIFLGFFFPSQIMLAHRVELSEYSGTWGYQFTSGVCSHLLSIPIPCLLGLSSSADNSRQRRWNQEKTSPQEPSNRTEKPEDTRTSLFQLHFYPSCMMIKIHKAGRESEAFLFTELNLLWDDLRPPRLYVRGGWMQLDYQGNNSEIMTKE